MRAVVCHAYGPPENLTVEEMPDPVAEPGFLLVRVGAVAVTFPDTLMLEDKYQFKLPPPYVPGGEVVGIVEAIGDGVEGFEIGDRVAGGLGVGGAFAELATIPALTACKIPDGVKFETVAGLNYGYSTTLYALKHRGQLAEGETLLVLGAGGQLGLTAVELGKLMGARVIACASSEDKLDICRARGADETINYATENLKKRAKELTDGKGVNVVYDGVGGDYAEQALRATAWEGRYLVIGFAAGIPSIPLNLALLKGCQIVGVFYGGLMANDPFTGIDITKELIGFAADGKLNPHVSGRYTLETAPEALRLMMDRKALGKLVILPNGDI